MHTHASCNRHTDLSVPAVDAKVAREPVPCVDTEVVREPVPSPISYSPGVPRGKLDKLRL